MSKIIFLLENKQKNKSMYYIFITALMSKNQKFLTKYLFWKSYVYVPFLLLRITMNDHVTRRRTFIML